MKVAVLVVAAGRGSRFGSGLPKQYQPLHGRPVLRHSLAAFAAHPAVHAVRAVIHPDDHALYAEAAAGLALLEPVSGGAERQDSVRLGLESLAHGGFDAVLIHDAARPLVSRAVVDRVLDALHRSPGAVPALPLADTLKRGLATGTESAIVLETVPRDGLWRVQTPQGFRFADILAAHRAVAGGPSLTDDAAVLEAAGAAVALVPGHAALGKITATADLAAAEAARPPLETRTGFGFDVHALVPGESVTLCGLALPHSHGLAGHSDADVALHALCDALYGAAAAGDIGHHFPPSDGRWKGAASGLFVEHARDLIAALGGRIVNVDLTIVCEAPRIGPHRAAMAARLARLLDVAPERVGVKATTTEGLGFTGRREGIAAQAVATITLPAPA